ncbi:unnamed protein product, partial [Allacma fusca]
GGGDVVVGGGGDVVVGGGGDVVVGGGKVKGSQHTLANPVDGPSIIRRIKLSIWRPIRPTSSVPDVRVRLQQATP